MIAFVDTFALIAWLNQKDAAHELVAGYLANFAGKLVTTEWVLVEFADSLASPASRSTAAAFLRAVRNDPLFEVIGYDLALYLEGLDLFAGRTDKGWSLTDCISFVAMTARGLTNALTADRHFEQAGFRAVFKS